MSAGMERAADEALEAETFKSVLGSKETFHSVHSSTEDIRDDHLDDERLALPQTQQMSSISNANSARSLAEGLPKVVITQPSDTSLLERKRVRTLSDTSNIGDSHSNCCGCCNCCSSRDKDSRCCCAIL